MKCRFAVVPFGLKRNRIPSIPLTDDIAAFKEQLTARLAVGGANQRRPPPRCSNSP